MLPGPGERRVPVVPRKDKKPKGHRPLSNILGKIAAPRVAVKMA